MPSIFCRIFVIVGSLKAMLSVKDFLSNKNLALLVPYYFSVPNSSYCSKYACLQNIQQHFAKFKEKIIPNFKY